MLKITSVAKKELEKLLQADEENNMVRIFVGGFG